MLDHPWMVDMRTKRVNMERYLSKVWGWDDVNAANDGGTLGGALGGGTL